MTLQHKETDARKVETTRDLPVIRPATDIFETEREIVVVADMPGVDEKHLDITLENNVLALAGRSEPAEPEGLELLYRETGAAEYRRTFTLTEDVDREKISARIKNGVLRLVLPKAAKAQPRRIAVEADA
jgi:HSP20 family protein